MFSAGVGARLLAAAAIPATIAAMLFASTTWASTSQRVALVIGNASYQHVPVLANPLNDAADIGATLGRLGFTVTIVENAGRAELWKGLQEFALAASASEMAVVFYAGHGIEVDKRNFLVPVDARLKSDADIEFETVPLELVSRAVERARGFRLIILDACRDNPFTVAMQRAGATRSIGRGLAPVEPSGGTLVAYAAKEGTVAADGMGRNSPYTSALLAHLEEPGLEVNLLFRQVRDAVVAATGGRQIPFTYGSLPSQAIYLSARPEAEPEPEPTPATATARSGGDSETPDANQIAERRIAAEKELLFWESVKDSTHAADFEAYLQHFPGGTYEVLARNRLARLKIMQEQESAARVATPDEPEPVSSPDPPAPTPESKEASLGLERAERRQIQTGLAALGFDPGPADGLFGRRTRIAIQEWQSSRGGNATGHLDTETAKALMAAAENAEATAERKRLEEKRKQEEAARKAAERKAAAQRIAAERKRLKEKRRQESAKSAAEVKTPEVATSNNDPNVGPPQWFKDFWREYLGHAESAYAVMAVDRNLCGAQYRYCAGSGCGQMLNPSMHRSFKDVHYKHWTLSQCREVARKHCPDKKPECAMYAIRDKIVWEGPMPWQVAGARQDTPLVASQRTFSLSYVGSTDIFTGTMEITAGKRHGRLSTTMDGRKCDGRFWFTSHYRGNWVVDCGGGWLTANGTFVGRGPNGGSRGTGVDSEGRMVEFVVDPADGS